MRTDWRPCPPIARATSAVPSRRSRRTSASRPSQPLPRRPTAPRGGAQLGPRAHPGVPGRPAVARPCARTSAAEPAEGGAGQVAADEAACRDSPRADPGRRRRVAQADLLGDQRGGSGGRRDHHRVGDTRTSPTSAIACWCSATAWWPATSRGPISPATGSSSGATGARTRPGRFDRAMSDRRAAIIYGGGAGSVRRLGCGWPAWAGTCSSSAATRGGWPRRSPSSTRPATAALVRRRRRGRAGNGRALRGDLRRALRAHQRAAQQRRLRGRHGPGRGAPADDFDRIVAVNLRGAFLGLRERGAGDDGSGRRADRERVLAGSLRGVGVRRLRREQARDRGAEPLGGPRAGARPDRGQRPLPGPDGHRHDRARRARGGRRRRRQRRHRGRHPDRPLRDPGEVPVPCCGCCPRRPST